MGSSIEKKREWTFPVCAPAAAAALRFAAAGGGYRRYRPPPVPGRFSPCRAWSLSTGQTFHGRLEGYGNHPNPILRQAYHVQPRKDPKTGGPMYLRVKRAQDRMILNGNPIVLVEPAAISAPRYGR